MLFNFSNILGQYVSENVKLLGRVGDSRSFGMAIDKNRAFVGGGCYLYIFDITDNSRPVLLSKLLTPSQIENIKILGEFAFIANSAAGLTIVNISDLGKPSIITSYKTKSVALDLDIYNNYVFVSDVYYGFVVINISNIQSPYEVFSFQSEGGEDIKVKDNKLFFCNNYNGLRIFDISNPAIPVLKSTFTQCSSAEKIVFYKDYVIISDQKYGIYILNISNINNIQIISKLPISLERQLTLYGDYLYTSAPYSYVKIIDVSNVNNPLVVRQYSISRYTRNIIIVDNNLFLLNVDTGLEIYDKRDNNNMIYNYLFPSYMREFDFYDHYITIAYSYAGVSVYDIKDPQNPTYANLFSNNFPLNSFDRQVNKVINSGYLCFMFTEYQGVLVFDIRDPKNPLYLSTLISGSYIILVRDNIYYLVSGTGTYVYDLTNPSKPILIKQIPQAVGNRILIDGYYAYMTNWAPDGKYKLFVYDISDYMKPQLTGSLDLQYYPYGIDYKDNVIYAACTNGGLFVIDVSNKSNPTIKNRIYSGNDYMSYVNASNNYLYVTNGIYGLLVFDISNINNIKNVGQFNFGSFAYYVKEYQGNVYVSSFDDGLYIFHNDLITSFLDEQKEILIDNLLQNYPNPFNPETIISFQLSKRQTVLLKIYNILGEEVATLIDDEMSAGKHVIKFDGSKLASGIYIYSIKTPSYSISKKMILEK